MRYPWAVPGRKVVCVDAENDPLLDGLTEGAIYTIRSIVGRVYNHGVALRLEEISRPIRPRDPFEVGYNITRFRPLHTVETDVALFAGLLTPAPNAPMLPVNINLEPTP